MIKVTIKAVIIFILFFPSLLVKAEFFPDAGVVYEFIIFVGIVLIVNVSTSIIENKFFSKSKTETDVLEAEITEIKKD